MRKLAALFVPILSALWVALLLTLLNAARPGAASLAAPLPEPLIHPTLPISAAHLVVQLFPGQEIVRSIRFSTPISGLAALQSSGLNVVTRDMGWGIAVCSIQGVGCPVDNCFCSDNFWNYSYWDGSAWQGYPVGASQSTVKDGGVEGWRWGPWDQGSLSPAPVSLAADQALTWLKSKQVVTTGGYGTASSSVEMLLSLSANQLNAMEWRQAPAQPSLLDYFLHKGAGYANGGADRSAKLAIGMLGSQGCWPANAKQPVDFYNEESGEFAAGAGTQSWGILGTHALSQTIPVHALQRLKAMALPGGAWEWESGWMSDTNSTSLAIQALIAAGEAPTSSYVTRGLAYLKSAQNTDGGFPYDPASPWPGGTNSDANSTSYAIQAIRAAGQDPITGTWVIGQQNTPISFLLNHQLSDGSFEWQTGYGSNSLATQQAISALLGHPLPYVRQTLADCSVAYLPVVTGR